MKTIADVFQLRVKQIQSLGLTVPYQIRKPVHTILTPAGNKYISILVDTTNVDILSKIPGFEKRYLTTTPNDLIARGIIDATHDLSKPFNGTLLSRVHIDVTDDFKNTVEYQHGALSNIRREYTVTIDPDNLVTVEELWIL